jgi:hypothetical protein
VDGAGDDRVEVPADGGTGEKLFCLHEREDGEQYLGNLSQ